MNQKQRILYFVPDCIITRKAGNVTRFKQMLDYLNNATNCEVDFVSLSDVGGWVKDTDIEFKKQYPNINLILLSRKLHTKDFVKKLIEYKIPNIIPKIKKLFLKKGLDFVSPFLLRKFTELVHSKKYDKIIITYAYWGNLIKNISYDTHKILDTHDFLTAQNQKDKNKIGEYFQYEMEIMNQFDEVWTFSVEEKYLFEQFSERKIVHLPIAFEQKEILKKPFYKYDILYVASHNNHNINSINWFLKEVFPLLKGKYQLHIVGRICEYVDDCESITKHGIVDDISEFYENAKMTICPMLSGTGVKIKVLESLAYNLPVVTNIRGVDGLLNKSENGCLVANTSREFADKIELLLTDEDFYLENQRLAHSFFKKNHNLDREKEFFKTYFPDYQ